MPNNDLMYEGRTLKDILESGADLLGELRTYEQWSDNIGQFSSDLGELEQGGIIFGSGLFPDNFSGVFMIEPPVTIDGEAMNIGGLNAGVLQFGLRASDGAAVFGGGAVVNDVNGITIKEGEGVENKIVWDVSGTTAAEMYAFIDSDPDTTLYIVSDPDRQYADSAILLKDNHGSGTDFSQIVIGNNASGHIALVVNDLGGISQIASIEIYNSKIVVNEIGGDIDFIVEGNTKTDLFETDALLEQVKIGGFLNFPMETVVIASAVATVTQSGTRLAAQSGTTDTLNTITGGNTDDILFLEADPGDVITVADNSDTGTNILLAGGNNKVLTAVQGDTLVLKKHSGGNWHQWGGTQN